MLRYKYDYGIVKIEWQKKNISYMNLLRKAYSFD